MHKHKVGDNWQILQGLWGGRGAVHDDNDNNRRVTHISRSALHSAAKNVQLFLDVGHG